MKKICSLLYFTISLCASTSAQTLPSKRILLQTPQYGTNNVVAQQSVTLKEGFKATASSASTFNAKIDEALSFNAEYLPTAITSADATASFNTNAPVSLAQGSVNVSPTGAATYHYPINIPAGIAGMEPNISIDYNSQGGVGLLGLGFNISGLSAITRVPKTFFSDGVAGGVHFDMEDRFSLDGNRLMVLDGKSYGASGSAYETEIQTFSKIDYKFNSIGVAYFQVITKDGKTLEYGNTPDSRVIAVGESGTYPMAWYLNRVIDANGNFMTFKYKNNPSTGEVVIEEILYTGNNGTGGITPQNSINFYYDIKTESRTSYVSGKSIASTMILRMIKCSIAGSKVRSYDFDYITKNSRSCLNKVTETLADGQVLNPTVFEWGKINGIVDNKLDIPSAKTPIQLNIPNASNADFIKTISSGDINGDGLSDIIVSVRGVIREANGLYPELKGVTYWSWLAVPDGNGGVSFPNGVLEGVKCIVEVDNPPSLFSHSNSNFGVPGVAGIFNLNGSSSSQLIIPNYSIERSAGTTTKNQFEFFAKGVATPVWIYCQDDNNIGNPSYTSGDLNNDAIDDIVAISRNPVNGNFVGKIRYGSNSKVDGDYTYVEGVLSFQTTGTPELIYITDLNLDGFKDIMVKTNSGFSIIKNDGVGSLNTKGVYTCGFTDVGYKAGLAGYEFINPGDFNGDGYLDFVVACGYNGKIRLALNNRSLGFNVVDIPEITPGTDCFSEYDDIIVTDLNQDEKSDLIIVETKYQHFPEYWENNSYHLYHPAEDRCMGRSVRWCVANTSGVGFTVVKDLPYVDYYYQTNQLKVQGDFNGDGRLDLINYGSDLFSGTSNEKDDKFRFYTNYNSSFEAGLIKSVTDGLNNTATFAYQPLNFTQKANNTSFYTKGTTSTYPFVDILAPLYCVSKLNLPNGVGGVSTTEYAYSGARAHLLGKGFLGFTKVEALNATANSLSTTTIQLDQSTLLPLKQSVETKLGGTLVTLTEDNYTIMKLSPSARPISLVNSSKSVDYQKGVTTLKTNTYDSDLNLSSTTVNVGGVDAQRTTYPSYVAVAPSAFKSKPTEIKVESMDVNGANPFSSRTQYGYDIKGNLTSEIKNAFSSRQVTTTFSNYNCYGFPEKANTVAGTYNITTENTITYNGGVITTTTKEPETGVIKTVIKDLLGRKGTTIAGLENPKITITTYNALGQDIKSILADGNVVNTTIKFEGSGQSGKALYSKLVEVKGRPWVKTYYDSFNRVVKEETVGVLGMAISTETIYDEKGLVKQKNSSAQGGQTTTVDYIYKSNDGRLESETYSSGRVVSYNYSGLTVTINDDGKYTTTVYDNRGNVKSITEPEGGTINYTYHSCGKPLTITTKSGVVKMEYDLFGNQTLLNDPNAGIQQYTYDALGRLATQTDPLGVVTTPLYNEKGQLISQTITKGTDIIKSLKYEYYTSTNATGLLAKIIDVANSNTVLESYTYDDYGRTLSTTKKIADLGDISYENSYDGYGNVSKITYPQSVEVTKEYDAYGNLIKVKSGGQAIWTLTAQDATKMNYTLGNGFVTEKVYNNYGMVTSIKSSKGATIVQDMSYDFNSKNGLLNSRTDNKYKLTESFIYDKIERLTQWTVKNSVTNVVSNSYSLGYVNDKVFGKSDIGTYQYDLPQPHAVSSVNAVAGYNPLGTQKLSYNENGKVGKIEEGTNTLDITYGYDDERVKSILTQNGAITCTTYFGGMYEKRVLPNNVSKEYFYINAGDGLAAVLIKTNGNAGEILYVHKDYLGSIIALTDNNSDVTKSIREEMNYDPWGRRRNFKDWSFTDVVTPTLLTRGYTGHEHLDAFNLINMNGRIYDPYLGMFISCDNYIQSPTSTQNFNRYTYCMGNPLKYTDPDGQIWHIIIGAAVGGVINWVSHGCEFTSRGLVAFGVGAFAGAVGAATGGAAFAAAGGAAGGAGGFAAGAFGGFVGSGFSIPLLSAGNTIFLQDPMMTDGEYLMGVGIGTLTGGLIQGAIALKNGLSFWTGTVKPLPPVRLPVELESPLKKIKYTIKLENDGRAKISAFDAVDELPDQQPFIKIKGDGCTYMVEVEDAATDGGLKSLSELGLTDGMQVSSSRGLELGEQFLGKGYTELVPGSGRFVSADGTRVFRMGVSDITGAHGGGPHFNFETLILNPAKEGKMMIDQNFHIYITD